MTSDKKWDPRKFDLDCPIRNHDLDTDPLCNRGDSNHSIIGECIGNRLVVDDDDSSLEDFISGETFEDASEHTPPEVPTQ